MEDSITITFQDGTQKELKASMVEAGGGGGGSSESTLKLYNETVTAYSTTNILTPKFTRCTNMTDEALAAVLTDPDTYSSIKTASGIFERCTSITSVIDLNFNEATTLGSLFYLCASLLHAPKLTMPKATNISYLFYGCQSLLDTPVIDCPSATDISYIFESCNHLQRAEFKNTGNVTTIQTAFSGCFAIEEIIFDDASSITSTNSAFYNCTNLKRLVLPGIKVSFSINSSNQLTREALVEILNNLATISSTQTLIMGSINLNKLTDDDKAIATNKGWTLA